MPFGLQKLAVLESKLDIYEDLSKEMLDKLERAVATISENSNRVAIILERHESRLAESERADQLIIKMIEELKDDIDDIDKGVKLKFHDQNKKIEEAQKWIWMAGAVLTTAVTVLQVLPNIGLSLTPVQKTSMMDAAVIQRIV
jgi:septal ring factor EnvC (AmiA/AmiB activator)